MTTFLRLLQSDEKAIALAAAVDDLRKGKPWAGMAFEVAPSSFAQVPEAPFAYWISEALRTMFSLFPPFEGNGRAVRVGLQTGDDFRFVRIWWEIDINQKLAKKKWVPFAKGGAYSPYYSDIHLVLDWADDGRELRNFKGAYIRNESYYFKPGLTWTPRALGGLNFRSLPAGCAFGHKGPGLFIDIDRLLTIFSLVNSRPFIILVNLQVAAASYEMGIIQKTPIPDYDQLNGTALAQLARSCVSLKHNLDTINDTSHVFILPALLKVEGDTITERADTWQGRVDETNHQLAEHQREIDNIAFRLYGIEGDDRQALEESFASGSRTVTEEGGVEEDGPDEGEEGDAEAERGADSRRLTADFLSWAVGSALGRWDVRLATGERSIPELPDPFAPLPVCSPGMLTGEDGLPLRQPPPGYPLKVDWDGILVDDPEHDDDIVRRVRDVLDLLWGDRAESIEREACDILGVKELRDYFRDPKRFWDDHVKRYSKSRRKAPIYWLIQSPRKHYGLWLYYHRLDPDILFKALHNYVEPKISGEENRLAELKTQRQSAGTGGKDVKRLEKEIDRQEAMLADLREFRDRLERAAKLYVTPDLNDGVILNIAPLWELVPWKEPRAYWEDLLAGKYEWSSIGKQLREKGLVTTK